MPHILEVAFTAPDEHKPSFWVPIPPCPPPFPPSPLTIDTLFEQIKLVGEGSCLILYADRADAEAKTYSTCLAVASTPGSPRASLFHKVSGPGGMKDPQCTICTDVLHILQKKVNKTDQSMKGEGRGSLGNACRGQLFDETRYAYVLQCPSCILHQGRLIDRLVDLDK